MFDRGERGFDSFDTVERQFAAGQISHAQRMTRCIDLYKAAMHLNDVPMARRIVREVWAITDERLLRSSITRYQERIKEVA